MKRITILFLAFLGSVVCQAQSSSMTITFSANFDEGNVPLDSIRIINQTQSCDTVLYWPDTVLNLTMTGVNGWDYRQDGFHLYQNVPNPVKDMTTVKVDIPDRDRVAIRLFDPLGRELLSRSILLESGQHNFTLIPGNARSIFFTVQWRESSQTIQVINQSYQSSTNVGLEYTGMESRLKKTYDDMQIQDFIVSIGDVMNYIGYANTTELILGSDVIESELQNSESFVLDITEGIPCVNDPLVNYGGQDYNTVQIGDQCWFKENLNIGTQISKYVTMSDNGVIEKYCYGDLTENCDIYGALYQWDEIMKYDTFPGIQGICPQGWHIPTRQEWQVLAVFTGGDDFCGVKLKSTYDWYATGNGTNDFGFNALPTGFYDCYTPDFANLYWSGDFWSSSEATTWFDGVWVRNLHYLYIRFYEYPDEKIFGYGVRCLKD